MLSAGRHPGRTRSQDRFASTRLHHELADAIPGAQLVEIPTGILPMVERPEEWQKLITAFLARHSA
ncbi:hypothetical protein AB0N09_27100 [Streptomyces erythrochromogenes]|uniref:alpha/beta fold hydrolase n=1 Tax=Streptomyces erythrochromogenes TaxID=285574 RepID=UPI00343924DC